MKTYLDCIPCFFKQALDAARMAGADEVVQKKVLDELSKLIPKLPLEASPPEIGREIYGLVRRISGKDDPFKDIKRKSNQMALSFFSRLSYNSCFFCIYIFYWLLLFLLQFRGGIIC